MTFHKNWKLASDQYMLSFRLMQITAQESHFLNGHIHIRTLILYCLLCSGYPCIGREMNHDSYHKSLQQETGKGGI